MEPEVKVQSALPGAFLGLTPPTEPGHAVQRHPTAAGISWNSRKCCQEGGAASHQPTLLPRPGANPTQVLGESVGREQLTPFPSPFPSPSRSRWVALRVLTFLKAEALLFFFRMDSIRILKNLKREDSCVVHPSTEHLHRPFLRVQNGGHFWTQGQSQD